MAEDDFNAGRAVGYAEGYLQGRDEPPAAGWVKIDESRLCICGVMSGGVRDPRPGCPFHVEDRR